MKLPDPIGTLALVGPIYINKLKKLDINTIGDLILHVPNRYIDYRHSSQISKLVPGEVVTIVGQIVSIQNIRSKKGKMMQIANVSDGEHSIQVLWFNQYYLISSMPPGTTVSLSGKVSFWNRKLVLFSPEYEKIIQPGSTLHTGRVVPIYPETAGVSSKWLRSRINHALNLLLDDEVEDFLSEVILGDLKLIGLKDAIVCVHKPKNVNDAEKGRKRLAFDELLALQLEKKMQRIAWQKKMQAHALKFKKSDILKFTSQLPFKLTPSQTRSINEISKDLKRQTPMNRLLAGDVGSGKTVVAATAAFISFINGHQSIFMAPTQILAQQHYETLKAIAKPFGIRVSLITSASSKKGYGKPDILVGTHALVYNKANFDEAALVVIDEQHKFGVRQRAKLTQKASKEGKMPNLLTMTATPIPRTIALTIYGDLDLSSLDELPKGRRKITTWVVPPKKRDSAYGWIGQQIKNEKIQVFVVCPLIEESEADKMLEVKAASVEFEKLKKVFPSLKLGLLHGRLKAHEKNKVLKKFKANKLDIIVTTPVVEVGIDIPNATIMMIEAADRFGLAQLHQLRGRVGRGAKKSYCLLFTDNRSKKVQSRLDLLSKIALGKELAELDLKLRGAGEVFGTKQHGFKELKIARWDDVGLIKKSRKLAEKVVKNPRKYKRVLYYFKNKQVAAN